jgi:transcriptional regulator with XRE-family HTH domain
MASHIDISIGAAIRRKRESLGLGLADLGRIIGVSAEKMRSFEAGEGHIGAPQLLLLSGAIDLPLPEIFADPEARSQPPARPAAHAGAG